MIPGTGSAGWGNCPAGSPGLVLNDACAMLGNEYPVPEESGRAPGRQSAEIARAGAA